QSRVSAWIKAERIVARSWEEVQEPPIERGRGVDVLVPVCEETTQEDLRLVRTVECIRKVRSWQRVKDEEKPVGDEDHDRDGELKGGRAPRQQEHECVSQANLAQNVRERKVGLPAAVRREEDCQRDENE